MSSVAMDNSDIPSSCGTQSSFDLTACEEEATAYESTDLSNSQFSSALTAALRQFQGDHGPLSSTTISQASASDAGGFPVLEVPDESQNQDTPCPLGEVTTVMVKNVPVKCGQRRLLRQFLAAGFQGKLDFIYLPMDPRSRSSRGFAFVNLTTVESAHRFYRIFHGNFLKNYPSETPLEVAVAEIQGFDANAEHYLLVKASRKGKGRDVFGCPTFLRPLQRHLVNHLRTLEEPKKPKSKSSQHEEASQDGQEGQDISWPPMRDLRDAALQYPVQQPVANLLLEPPYRAPMRPEAASTIPMRVPMAYPQKPEQLLPRQPASILSPQVAGFEVHDPSHCWNCGRLITGNHSFCPFCGEAQLPATSSPGQSFWI